MYYDVKAPDYAAFCYWIPPKASCVVWQVHCAWTSCGRARAGWSACGLV